MDGGTDVIITYDATKMDGAYSDGIINKYLLCNGCVKFFENIKNKEMAGIKDIEKVR